MVFANQLLGQWGAARLQQHNTTVNSRNQNMAGLVRLAEPEISGLTDREIIRARLMLRQDLAATILILPRLELLGLAARSTIKHSRSV
jgi:hypothetical protein